MEFPRLLAVDHAISSVVNSYSFSGTDSFRPTAVTDIVASQQNEVTHKMESSRE